MLASLFLKSYTALLPRPHLLKLVDLADEEVPIASSNLCVCDMDHVLGREEHEVRKRTALAGRQQALTNARSFTPALVQHHTYLTCVGPSANIQFSVGYSFAWDGSQIHIVFTFRILAHSAYFCLSLQQFDSPNPDSCSASLYQQLRVMLSARRARLRHSMRPYSKRSALQTKNKGQPVLLCSKKPSCYCYLL